MIFVPRLIHPLDEYEALDRAEISAHMRRTVDFQRARLDRQSFDRYMQGWNELQCILWQNRSSIYFAYSDKCRRIYGLGGKDA